MWTTSSEDASQGLVPRAGRPDAHKHVKQEQHDAKTEYEGTEVTTRFGVPQPRLSA